MRCQLICSTAPALGLNLCVHRLLTSGSCWHYTSVSLTSFQPLSCWALYPVWPYALQPVSCSSDPIHSSLYPFPVTLCTLVCALFQWPHALQPITCFSYPMYPSLHQAPVLRFSSLCSVALCNPACHRLLLTTGPYSQDPPCTRYYLMYIHISSSFLLMWVCRKTHHPM